MGFRLRRVLVWFVESGVGVCKVLGLRFGL